MPKERSNLIQETFLGSKVRRLNFVDDNEKSNPQSPRPTFDDQYGYLCREEILLCTAQKEAELVKNSKGKSHEKDLQVFKEDLFEAWD